MEHTSPSLPTSRQVEIFRTVMRCGGISSAGRLLNLSQPAVSYQIAALERSLALELFLRERGRLIPTREGQALAAQIERHFVGMDQIVRAATHLRDQVAGQVNVGALPALAFTVMPIAVARFKEAYPGVKVSLQTTSSSSIKDGVSNASLDVGFVASEVDTHGVRYSEYTAQHAMVVMPRSHRLARSRSVQPRDLRGEPFVALNPEDATRSLIETAMSAARVELEVAAETPYAIGVCALVAAGVGIGLVNPLSVRDAQAQGLALVPFRPRVTFRHLLLLPPGASSRTARAFVALARSALP
ncbi:MAG: LysR family transcriptional regulator [Ideonella sp.]|nr:LysR family transcriptional regulator [Ideonella sp.]